MAEYVYHWRASMEYFMFKHFRLCLTLLENKFDAVGAGFHAIHALLILVIRTLSSIFGPLMQWESRAADPHAANPWVTASAHQREMETGPAAL